MRSQAAREAMLAQLGAVAGWPHASSGDCAVGAFVLFALVVFTNTFTSYVKYNITPKGVILKCERF